MLVILNFTVFDKEYAIVDFMTGCQHLKTVCSNF